MVLRPGYSGVALTDISPVVEICRLDRATMACEPGTPLLAELGMDAGPVFDRVFLGWGGNYWVTWRRSVFTPEEGKSYRVSVVVAGLELGFFDVEIRPGGRWWNLTRNDGFVQIADTGPFLFGFRVEEGALEQAFCDAAGQGLEDCDVQLVGDETGGTLRVFENPGATGETPAAVVVIPANSALLEGEPISEFVVIAELEDEGTTQGGGVPGNNQVPYFLDFRTEPPGIEFDTNGGGVQITICQDLDFLATVPESLHPFLRPFIVYSDGTTVLPGEGEYSVGAAECEGYGVGSLDQHSHGKGLLGRFAEGLSRAGRSLLPRPLFARRLHGGLNTTVYSTRGDVQGEGDNAPAFELAAEEFRVEVGAILDVDPLTTFAVVPNGEVGSPTQIWIQARNGLEEPFPFGGNSVVVTISGANAESPAVVDHGDGTYSTSYTPAEAGQDLVTITLDGQEISGSPYLTEVSGYGVLSVVARVDGAPAQGIQILLFDASAQIASAITDATGELSFPNLPYGSYLVQAAGGYDFDVAFPQPTRPVDLASTGETVEFLGITQALPANVRVWRLADGGNGNAYEYVRSFGSWSDGAGAALQTTLLGVAGHLGTVTSAGENAFVNNLRFVGIPNPTGAQASVGAFPPDDMRAWIGLTDEAQEGVFAWVTGEPFSFANWGAGEPNNGDLLGAPRQEFVEMLASGSWNDTTAANPLNQGYVAEWEVGPRYPAPPFSG